MEGKAWSVRCPPGEELATHSLNGQSLRFQIQLPLLPESPSVFSHL